MVCHSHARFEAQRCIGVRPHNEDVEICADFQSHFDSRQVSAGSDLHIFQCGY
jgi:hypothetical protein